MKIKELLPLAVKPRRKIEYLLYTLGLFAGILIDQLTKLLAVKYLMPIPTFPLIDGVLHLTYVENPGAAFGMLKDAPWVFNTFSVIAVVAIGLYLYLGHAEKPLTATALVLIASGGIGNMIDRITLKYVVDFIDFRLIDFAVFNGADSFVCIGAGLLVLSLIMEIIEEAREEKK